MPRPETQELLAHAQNAGTLFHPVPFGPQAARQGARVGGSWRR